MGFSRRVLSLIVDKRIDGAKSLTHIDLTRPKLFNTLLPALPLNGNTSDSEREGTLCAGKPKMSTIRRLPAPSFNFQVSATDYERYMHCFPLAGDRILCTDQSGRSALFTADITDQSGRSDLFKADMFRAEAMPFLHFPKRMPLSIFVPNDDNDGGGRIYIMERSPRQENKQLSREFEAFIYRKPTMTSFTKSWQCELLPPPPFTCNPEYYLREVTRPMICSYAVVGGGSHVCVSVDSAGTYCLDTVTHAWTHVGNWTLPFLGKVEYVPELNLWFGICAEDFQLGAVDLSTMDMNSEPQLLYTWKEFEAPQEWTELQRPQFVNLGSGRFCIARFFHALNPLALFDPDAPEEEYFTVLTGTDVVPCSHDSNGTANADCSSNISGSNSKVELKMVKHNSRRHMSYGSDGKIYLIF